MRVSVLGLVVAAYAAAAAAADIHAAVSADSSIMIREALDAGASVDTVGPGGQTPLMAAVLQGKVLACHAYPSLTQPLPTSSTAGPCARLAAGTWCPPIYPSRGTPGALSTVGALPRCTRSRRCWRRVRMRASARATATRPCTAPAFRCAQPGQCGPCALLSRVCTLLAPTRPSLFPPHTPVAVCLACLRARAHCSQGRAEIARVLVKEGKMDVSDRHQDGHTPIERCEPARRSRP